MRYVLFLPHFIEEKTEAQRNNLPTVIQAIPCLFVSFSVPLLKPFLEGETWIYLPPIYSDPTKCGFHSLLPPPTIHTNRSTANDLLTSSCTDCLLFFILLHFSEAFHNVDTPHPFQSVGASHSWLCSYFVSHLPSTLSGVSYFIRFWTALSSILHPLLFWF